MKEIQNDFYKVPAKAPWYLDYLTQLKLFMNGMWKHRTLVALLAIFLLLMVSLWSILASSSGSLSIRTIGDLSDNDIIQLLRIKQTYYVFQWLTLLLTLLLVFVWGAISYIAYVTLSFLIECLYRIIVRPSRAATRDYLKINISLRYSLTPRYRPIMIASLIATFILLVWAVTKGETIPRTIVEARTNYPLIPSLFFRF